MISRTFNSKLVQKILSDETLYRRNRFDTIECFSPELQTDMYYLLATEEDIVLGLIAFHAQNAGCYQGHVNYLPEHWGRGLHKYTAEAIEWMFNNSDCKKIFAFIPDIFPEIRRHAIKSGMHKEGALKDSYFYKGITYSQTIVGIEKNV